LQPVPVPKKVNLFVKAASGGTYVLFEDVRTTTVVGKLKALIHADDTFSHIKKDEMSLRLIAHVGKGVPTPEAEMREGDFLELADPTLTLAEAVTELRKKTATDADKLFFVISVPAPPLPPPLVPLEGESLPCLGNV
jgi:hypothetical protein